MGYFGVSNLTVDRLTVALLKRVEYAGQVQLLEDHIQFRIGIREVQCRRRERTSRPKRPPFR